MDENQTIDDVSDLPLIQPEMWGSRSTDKVPSMKRAVMKSLSKSGRGGAIFGKGTRGGNPARGRKAAATRSTGISARRVIIKARVVKTGQGGMKAAGLHMKYIQRDGVGEDGEKGRLFGKEEREVSADDLTKPIPGEKHQFRFIISPEDGHDIDLEKFTKTLMNQAKIDTGQKLIWGAVNHYNTDNPHVHIVVRGIDELGDQVWLDREYISRGLRNRSSEIVTRELGHRTEIEIDQALVSEITKERFTSLDLQLNNRMIDHQVSFADYDINDPGRFTDSRLMSRIDKLKEVGLVKTLAPRKFEFVEGWQDKLKAMGQRGDIIKTIHAELGRNDTGNYHIHGHHDDIQIEGVVSRKGLADELSERQFMIVENERGEIHYLEADHKTQEVISEIQEGVIVKLETQQESWLKPSDKNIADIARDNDNIYSSEMHQKAIGAEYIVVNGKNIKTEAFVDAHKRRVQRLSRFGLAQDLGHGRFLVNDDLEKKLRTRDKTHPVKNLKILTVSKLKLDQMVEYKGCTWLDRHTANLEDETKARSGFGSEVTKQARTRARFVEHIGVNPADPARIKKLELIERKNVIQQEAKKTGLKHVQIEPGQNISGELKYVREMPSGKKYLRIDNARSQEFSLVPWRKDFENLIGKQVQLSMDMNNRTKMKQISMGLGR